MFDEAKIFNVVLIPSEIQDEVNTLSQAKPYQVSTEELNLLPPPMLSIFLRIDHNSASCKINVVYRYVKYLPLRRPAVLVGRILAFHIEERSDDRILSKTRLC